MPPNEGYLAGIAQHTPAARLGWALKGAKLRKKELRLTAVGALAEGRKLRDSITAKATRAGVPPEDTYVAILFANADFTAMSPVVEPVPVEGKALGPQEEIALLTRHLSETPVGFLVGVIAREAGPGQGIYLHARPLLIDHASMKINEQGVRVVLAFLTSQKR